MKIKELRLKNKAELETLLRNSRSQLADLSFKARTKQIKSVRDLRDLKKLIARILTLLTANKQ